MYTNRLFEKSVLFIDVSLFQGVLNKGFHCSTTNFVPFFHTCSQIKPGFDMGYGQSVFSVGELLRLFCTNLHDQIKHRVYFYKAAPMVRLVCGRGGREGREREGREGRVRK